MESTHISISMVADKFYNTLSTFVVSIDLTLLVCLFHPKNKMRYVSKNSLGQGIHQITQKLVTLYHLEIVVVVSYDVVV